MHPLESRQAAEELPLRPQDEVECRRCGVHCDKVVYPAACVRRACPFLYAYEDHGHTYVGCLHKVFEVESCYESRAAEVGCLNPEFFELPIGEPSFRVFAQLRSTSS